MAQGELGAEGIRRVWVGAGLQRAAYWGGGILHGFLHSLLLLLLYSRFCWILWFWLLKTEDTVMLHNTSCRVVPISSTIKLDGSYVFPMQKPCLEQWKSLGSWCHSWLAWVTVGHQVCRLRTLTPECCVSWWLCSSSLSMFVHTYKKLITVLC